MQFINNQFYGNANSFSSKGFVFDKIYPNYNTLNNSEDNVFLGRFVLIDYYYSVTGEQNEEIYENNANADKIYQRNYHSTVFIKTINGYLEVARLETAQVRLWVDNDGVLSLRFTDYIESKEE